MKFDKNKLKNWTDRKWKKYGYTNSKEKNNLKETLVESTGGYCMYCYARVCIYKARIQMKY